MFLHKFLVTNSLVWKDTRVLLHHRVVPPYAWLLLRNLLQSNTKIFIRPQQAAIAYKFALPAFVLWKGMPLFDVPSLPLTGMLHRILGATVVFFSSDRIPPCFPFVVRIKWDGVIKWAHVGITDESTLAGLYYALGRKNRIEMVQCLLHGQGPLSSTLLRNQPVVDAKSCVQLLESSAKEISLGLTWYPNSISFWMNGTEHAECVDLLELHRPREPRFFVTIEGFGDGSVSVRPLDVEVNGSVVAALCSICKAFFATRKCQFCGNQFCHECQVFRCLGAHAERFLSCRSCWATGFLP